MPRAALSRASQPRTGPEASSRDLLALADLPVDEARALLRRAAQFARQSAGMSAGAAPDAAAGAEPPSWPVGSAPLVATLFFEDSTRTRTSFAIAAQRLGCAVADLSTGASSVNKGETILDTARTVRAMGARALVVRTRQSGAPAQIARALQRDAATAPVATTTPVAVINAGDGRHEHPTQGLLDALTIAEHHQRLDTLDLRGLRVCIVGDIANSRVARSNLALLPRLGAKVVCVGPPLLAPASAAHCVMGTARERAAVEIARDLDEHLPDADVVMMLRIQFERAGAGHEADAKGAAGGPGAPPVRGTAIASVREYRRFFALTRERLAMLKPTACVMHPGPMNRGIEIDADAADALPAPNAPAATTGGGMGGGTTGPVSLVTRQVALGVAVRMAVIERAVGEAEAPGTGH